MKRFGLALNGCEGAIEALIKGHVKGYKPEDVYTLIEVGSAGCVTLRAFHDIIKEGHSGLFRVVGFDLSPAKAWSLDMPEVHQSFAGLAYNVVQGDTLDRHVSDLRPVEGMWLSLLDDPRSYLKDSFPFLIDFAFIDGCHGKCAAHDFEAIESKVRAGGLVMFHDVGVLEQGRDWQPHCQEYINVRKHITDLGLLDGSRPGWKVIGEIPGSRVWGGDGNSCAVFQKL